MPCQCIMRDQAYNSCQPRLAFSIGPQSPCIFQWSFWYLNMLHVVCCEWLNKTGLQQAVALQCDVYPLRHLWEWIGLVKLSNTLFSWVFCPSLSWNALWFKEPRSSAEHICSGSIKSCSALISCNKSMISLGALCLVHELSSESEPLTAEEKLEWGDCVELDWLSCCFCFRLYRASE